MNKKRKAAKATDILMIPIYLAGLVWLVFWYVDGLDDPSELEIIQRQVDALYLEEQTVIIDTIKVDKK